jgi:hypothetical protein
MHEAFEQLAERGQERGADAVHDGALRRAARRRRDRRLLAAVVVAATAAVLSAPLWWPSRQQSSTGVVTTPPDVASAPVHSVDIDVPLATTDGWRPVLTIPYGDGVEQLGVDRVGNFGPESAAMAGDQLVVLDTHKGRLVSLSADGSFISATPLPGVSGPQFVTPIEGGVVISGAGKAFALADGGSDWLPITEAGPYTDGTRAFCCGGVSAVRFANGRPVVEQTKGYRTNDGRRFQYRRDGDVIEIQFADPQPHTTRLNLRIDGAAAGISSLLSELGVDGYGNVVVLLAGAVDQGPTRSALVLIGPDGRATVTAAPSPFGATSSGTPQHLSTGAGDHRVIVEAADGLEVWMPSPRTDPAFVPRAFEVATSTGCERPHEAALADGTTVEGAALAVVWCRIGERQLAIVVYADHGAVLAAAAELGRSCGTRVIGDDWIVQTNTLDASTLVAQRIGGDVPPIQNC